MLTKKRIIITTAIIAAIACATLLTLWACQTITRYHVILHQNYFEYTAYTDDNSVADMPVEIMLTGFIADTVSNDGSYLAQTLVQPRANNNPENIVELTFAPYQVHNYNNHRLYIESYNYNKETQQLIVIMIVEQRRYQTW